MNNNFLDFYITTMKEINKNYSLYPSKRYYRLIRFYNVCKYYIQHTKDYLPKHKGILLDLLFEYYCYILNNKL